MRRLLPLALVALASVASAQTPTLDGLPLWNGDVRRAPQEVRDAIATWQSAHRPLPSPRGRSLEATNAWATEVYRPWMERQSAALDAAEAALTRPDAPASWRLLAAVVVGDVVEHVVTRITELPTPEEIAGDPALVEMYATSMREGVSTALRERALPAFERCVALAGSSPWAARCAARANVLRAQLGPGVPPSSPPSPNADVRGATSMPRACTPAAFPFPDEASASPNINVESVVALDYHGSLRGPDAERLIAAVERTLTRRGLRLLPRPEVRAALEQVQSRRTRSEGPVCQVGPSLASVLAPRHPNLLLATASHTCLRERCELAVTFRRPARQGDSTDDVPDRLSTEVAGRTPNARDWIAAAARLEPGHAPLVGVLISRAAAENPDFQVAHPSPSDAVFSVASRLRAQSRDLRACFAGPGVVALHVRAQLDASGRVTNSEVQTLEATGPEPALAELRACVQRVVAATPFPCPPDGVSTVEANVCFTARPRGNGR